MSIFRRSLIKKLKKEINPIKCLMKEDSTKRCYINTGILANINTKVEIKIKSPEFLQSNQSNQWCFFGSRISSTSDDRCFLALGYPQFFAGFGNQSRNNLYWESNKDYKIELDTNTCIINDTVYNLDNTLEFESKYPLLLGAMSNNNSVDNRQHFGSIYYCKIWQGNELVRDLIPCLDDKAVACMYDKVTKRYFYSEIDSFDYEIIDENYTGRLDYIQSDGNQWIDTEFIPSSSTKVEIDLAYVSGYTQFIFGSRTSTSSNDVYDLLLYKTDNLNFRSDFVCSYSGSDSYKAIQEMTGYPRFKIIKDKNITTYVNNFVKERDYQEFQSSYNMYIFAINQSDTAYLPSSIKLYSLKIYEDDVLIRDFVPWLDENKVPCLYDYITDKCYYNQGTSDFLYSLEKTKYQNKGCLLDLDGINNSRTGHDSTATIWEDLSGNNNDCSLSKMEGYIEWGDDYLRNTNTKMSADINIDTDIVLCEYEKTISFGISDSSNHEAGLFATTMSATNVKGLVIYNNFIAQRISEYNKQISYNFFGENIAFYDVIITRNKIKLYKNGVLIAEAENIYKLYDSNKLRIFGTYHSEQRSRCMSLHKLLVYNRALIEEEIKLNYKINKSRFNVIEESTETVTETIETTSESEV